MKNDLTLMQVMERFSTEEKAREYVERMRWPNGPVCPHCGNADAKKIWRVTPNPEKKIRPGLYKCAQCREGFTCTINTIMEDSHIPLNKWLVAFYLMCASKTQISALQLQRHLELGSYRSAWFLCHRIRFALKDLVAADQLKGTVESDETWVGGRARGRGRAYTGNKTAIVALVERGGRVRSTVFDKVSGRAITRLLRQHIAPTSHLNTDESELYRNVGKHFASHQKVNHNRLRPIFPFVRSNEFAPTSFALNYRLYCLHFHEDRLAMRLWYWAVALNCLTFLLLVLAGIITD